MGHKNLAERVRQEPARLAVEPQWALEKSRATSAVVDEARHKLDMLRGRLRELGSVLVCYSGGVDSALLLAVAHEELGARAVALTAVSPSLPMAERDEAVAFARSLGADHRLVDSSEIEDPDYVANRPDRCFHCKSELYRVASRKQREWSLHAIVNGTNLDDLGDYRPGLDAARLANVVSPLVDAGFRKSDVRAAASALGLSVWNKPAAACLSSRIPYGTPVTRERLTQIEGFETALRALGFRQLRVRHHGELARIELALDELPRASTSPWREQLLEAGRAQGYQYVTVDLGGYRVGSHNELLPRRSLPIVTVPTSVEVPQTHTSALTDP